MPVNKMQADEYKLIENLLTKHYTALENNIDTIARRAANAVVAETMSGVREDLKEYLTETIGKVSYERSKQVVFLVTGEDIDDKGRCSILRGAAQWAIRQSGRSTLVFNVALTVLTSSIVGTIVAFLIKK